MMRKWLFGKTQSRVEMFGFGVVAATSVIGNLFLTIGFAFIFAVLIVCFNLEDDNQ